MSVRFRRQSPATSPKQGPKLFDAEAASAVFFKLPCLKLFDHDKMKVSQQGPVLAVKAPVSLRGGMNGGFESWRDGPGDRATRGDGKTEAQIQAQ
jgi:hypothetical protein